MRGHIETLKYTVRAASAAVAAQQLVGFGDGPCGADEPVQGMAHTDTAAGDAMTVTAIGRLELVASVAIAKGDPVYSDADGTVTNVGETNPFGRALTATTAPGEIVAVLMR